MCAGGVVGGGAVRGGGLLFSLDARPAAAQTPDEPDEPDESDDWPPVRAGDGQGVWGTPEACPDGSEVLFDYKKTLRKFKNGFNDAISDEDRGTVAELVVSAGEKRREVDRSLCVRDLPPCPVSVFQAGQTPTVYMADPADPLFEHRGLDANFAVRSQHVVDFGADFNAAWLAQKEAIGQGYRLSENPKYWRIAAPEREEPFKNMDADVGNHEPFEEMHPDRCVDAVAEPDPAVVPSDYSECVADKPEVVVPDDGGTASYLPYAKMAFVFATAAEPAVRMCVRFARKACPPGTLLTAVPQRFKPAAAPVPGAVDPIGEMVVQHRCRSLVRRTWTCPVDPKGKVIYEPMNQFNRCTERPASPAAGRSEAPCRETEGTPAREKAFKGFFGAADCDDYVRGNFAADPAACSDFGFADVGDAGLEPGKPYPRDPYQKLNGYLKGASVLTEVDAGVRHWCKFNPGLLRDECHGNKRPGKLEDCGEDVMKDVMNMERESVCLITKNDSGGCAAIVHAIECLATAAAIKANDDDHSDLGKALLNWQDYRNCAPCTGSPFNPGSGCETSASSSADSSTALVDQDLVDMLTWFVYGREQHHFDTYLREVEKSNKMKGTTLKARLTNDLLKDAVELFARRGEHQSALFNGGGPNSLGYPTSDRPPCPDAVNNKWNLAKDAAFDAYIKWYVVGLWPVSLIKFETNEDYIYVEYLSNRLKYFEDNVAEFNALEPLKQTVIRDYNEFASRALSSGESSGACFDLSPIAPACRVPFSGSLSHRSGNGTGVVLSNMRTDIRVRDLPSPVGMENSRWMPEPSGGGDADPEPFESAGPAIVDSIADVDPKHGIKCAFAGDPPHVELVITEMWPDQQLDYDRNGVIDADGEFIKEFKELFDNEPLDWWGLTCKASELVSTCGENETEAGYLTEVKQSCEESWTVKECRRRLTAQQGLDYLPDLSGDDLHEGAKRVEILRRNRERVTCKDNPKVPGLDFSCPWQPSRSGYFRLAAVAIWEIKHCIDSIDTHKCEIEGPNDREDVPYGKMGAMTVSEPLGVVVYSATSEGRSVALEDNLNLGG